jgi:bacillolysin
MMRSAFLRAAVGAALVLSALGAPVAARSESAEASLVSRLGAARVSRSAATGAVTFVRGSVAEPAVTSAELGHPRSPRAAARRFVERHGAMFGVRGAADVRVERTTDAGQGRSFVRLQQLHRGVPVIGGDLVVQVDAARNVISANGEAAPGLRVDTTPAVTAATAARGARETVAKTVGVRAGDLSATPPSLAVYEPKLLGGRALPIARLVWRMDVTSPDGDTRELVLVDAVRGGVALRIDRNPDAKNRRVCDAGNNPLTPKVPCTSGAAARVEGGAPHAVADVNQAYVFSGDTYDFFFNRFGRDSLDGAGMALLSTVRFCDPDSACPYTNAFWNGQQMVYGQGFTADDVVGHELAHGVTEFTSHLFYYYQSGAINEALSDIFGELIDLTNTGGTDNATTRWQLGEDVPGYPTGLRDMEDPTLKNDPDRMRSSFYTADVNEQDGGGVHTNSGVANKAAFLMTDGATFNGETVSGIGIDKVAAIWYRVAAHYLGSASDYADLGVALNQACSDLTGTTPKNGAGSPSAAGAITAGNCTEVSQAVLATEMALQPTTAGAAAPHAPVCSSGTPSNVFFDNLENTTSGNWASGQVGTGPSDAWYYPQTTYPPPWDPTYATSGDTNFYGDDFPDSNDSAIRMVNGVVLPANAFLHFAHAYGFEENGTTRYDGGVIEYSSGGGAWVDAGSLVSHNGYNGTLVANNPLGARQAFTAESNGYIQTRLNLSSLSGQNVRFRFRLGTDSSTYNYGWFIDDIRIYTCATGDTTPPTVGAPTADFRTGAVGTSSVPLPIRVQFTATDTSGIATTQLQQKIGSGAFTTLALSPANATTKNLSVAAHNTNTQTLRARATDASPAGNTSPYATGAPFKARAFQNGVAALVEGGTWTTASNASHYGGSVRHASAAGRTVTLTQTMTDVAFVTTKGPNRGIVKIFIDGATSPAATIDLYSASTQYRRVVFTMSFTGAPASRTVQVFVTGTKNASSSGKRVDVDALLIMQP